VQHQAIFFFFLLCIRIFLPYLLKDNHSLVNLQFHLSEIQKPFEKGPKGSILYILLPLVQADLVDPKK